ncbi:MAG TPA: addiction module protein [Verrucomicrobiae bacterium]|nr:addiction module protein [Verrucomicrobiae bacterium]
MASKRLLRPRPVRPKVIAHPIGFDYLSPMAEVATIEREALELAVAERALLADRLLRTLNLEDAERMERWGQEAERRLQALERGEMDVIDGSEAIPTIRRRLG